MRFFGVAQQTNDIETQIEVGGPICYRECEISISNDKDFQTLRLCRTRSCSADPCIVSAYSILYTTQHLILSSHKRHLPFTIFLLWNTSLCAVQSAGTPHRLTSSISDRGPMGLPSSAIQGRACPRHSVCELWGRTVLPHRHGISFTRARSDNFDQSLLPHERT